MTIALLARCLSRMAGWVRLSVQSIDYEYPDRHLLLSFSVFNLSKTGKKVNHGFDTTFEEDCFERLACAFGGTTTAMKQHHAEHKHYAIVHYKAHEGDGSASAWTASVAKRSCSGTRLDESNGFRCATHAHQSWDGFTTSELERGFSGIKAAIGRGRESLGDTSQWKAAKLLYDIPEARADDIISVARVIWLDYWRAARATGESRSIFSQ